MTDSVTGEAFDYVQRCAETKSDKFHGELVSRNHVKVIMGFAIYYLRELDKIKKGVFYGNKSHLPFVTNIEPNFNTVAFENLSSNNPTAYDIIHSIIGKATEVGESLEALAAALFEGQKFDTVNFVEEVGDGLWYDAIGLRAVGTDFETTQRLNIKKLQDKKAGRYKKGQFDSVEAINRNIEAERNILENKG